jgi:hypothetical protein
MRTHATLTPVWGAAAAGTFLSVGFKIADAGEFTTPVSPAGTPLLDWMLIRYLYPQFTGATINTTQSWEIDLRAKRKCEEMSDSYGIFVTNNTGVTNTLDAVVRTLLALP